MLSGQDKKDPRDFESFEGQKNFLQLLCMTKYFFRIGYGNVLKVTSFPYPVPSLLVAYALR